MINRIGASVIPTWRFELGTFADKSAPTLAEFTSDETNADGLGISEVDPGQVYALQTRGVATPVPEPKAIALMGFTIGLSLCGGRGSEGDVREDNQTCFQK